MFKPGDKFYFKHDTAREAFTVKGVSADGEMIESDELGGWSWADGAIKIEPLGQLELLPEPPDEDMEFLSM